MEIIKNQDSHPQRVVNNSTAVNEEVMLRNYPGISQILEEIIRRYEKNQNDERNQKIINNANFIKNKGAMGIRDVNELKTLLKNLKESISDDEVGRPFRNKLEEFIQNPQ